MREMDWIFETIQCTELDKRQFATFQLTNATADWWESKKVTLGNDAI